MQISNKDLSLICNYIESSKPSQPKLQFNYIDMVESESEEAILARKSKNRELAIDAIVEGKIEEFNNSKIESPKDYKTDSLSGMSIISTVIKTLSATSVNYTTIDEIYFAIIKKLDQLSSQTLKSGSMDLTLQGQISFENQFTNSRKIIARILYCSNKIAAESRYGPANTVICGYEVYTHLLHAQSLIMTENGICKAVLSNLNIIPTNLIDSKKTIVLRVSSRFENGINCSNFTNDLRYFLVETPDYEKHIKWFSII